MGKGPKWTLLQGGHTEDPQIFLLISLKNIEAITPELPHLPNLSDNQHPPPLLQ